MRESEKRAAEAEQRMTWRKVAQNTFILRVEGGWLYRYDCYGSYGQWEGNQTNAALVFVPDALVETK